MAASSDLETLLEQHRRLQHAMPFAWNAFFSRFGSLRQVQLDAMPSILNGRSVLVTAPTAGGKTEAVLAPICERLARHKWPGLSTLLITPTRALVNDLYMRLFPSCDKMRIRLGRKTADHPLGNNIVDQILITTPESFESLLTFRPKSLAQVQAVVMDEIHLLDGSPRGDQLRILLNRLSTYRHYVGGEGFAGLQRVAMSATVAVPRRLADVYVGIDSDIISVQGQRDLESKIILANGSDKDRAQAAIDAVESFEDVHKILVFVNSRKQVDASAGDFKYGRFSKVPIYGHHGSLSKSQREETETRFKADPVAICVATMTLEVGIDIGDIDLVICMDPPFSLSSFLQRIGRGCRRLNGKTRVLCIARDQAGELMFRALIRQTGLGVPAGPTPPFRRSVFVQQVLAYLKQVSKHRRLTEQFYNAFLAPGSPYITESCLQEVLKDMVLMGWLDGKDNVYQPASEGWGFVESDRIFGNIQPNPLEVALVDVESGKTVATVRSVHLKSGGVRIAGRSYELLAGGSHFEQKIRGGGQHEVSPKYNAQKLPYSFEIGACLAGYFNVRPNQLLVLPVGTSVVFMTWLGQLLNAALAEGFRRRGYLVTGGSFHLTLELKSGESDLLHLLWKTVQDVTTNNPLSGMPTERLVDLGPHFKCLSSQFQTKAREDWLDQDFLRSWCAGITEIEHVAADSELASKFIALLQ